MTFHKPKTITPSNATSRSVTSRRRLSYVDVVATPAPFSAVTKHGVTIAGRSLKRTRRIVGICSIAAILAVPALTAGTAWAATGGLPGTGDRTFNPAGDVDGNHCFTSEGVDANEVFGVSEQLLAQGTGLDCGPVSAGEFYTPIGGAFWWVNTFFEAVPADYTPAAPTPVEDFLAKAESLTYVIDPGTPHEKTYRYRVQDIAAVHADNEMFPVSGAAFPFVFFLAKLPPLPPGDHTYQVIIEMSARHCDGLGTSTGNCLEPGPTTLCTPLPFTVQPRAVGKP